MAGTLFSTYRQGENRVTATILAVFERLNLSLVERILQSASEDSNLSLVAFENQARRETKAPNKMSGHASVPDARLSGSFSYWIETKRVPGEVTRVQLEEHLARVHGDRAEHAYHDRRLFVITPDERRPAVIDDLLNTPGPLASERQLKWISFEVLADAITALIEPGVGDPDTGRSLRPTEREVFLLGELLDFLVDDGLVETGHQNRVLVVPAGVAYGEYRELDAYICQANRTFQRSSRIAFYSQNRIRREVPPIQATIDEVLWTEAGIAEACRAAGDGEPQIRGSLALPEIEARLRELLAKLLASGVRAYGTLGKVILLKPLAMLGPDDLLDYEIPNDLKSESGRTTAFVQNQRYVSWRKLRGAKRTSDLAGSA